MRTTKPSLTLSWPWRTKARHRPKRDGFDGPGMHGLAIRIRNIGRPKFLESQNPSAQESERILFNVSFLQILMLLSLVAIFQCSFPCQNNLPPSVSGNSILLEAFRHSPHGLCRAQLGGYTDGFWMHMLTMKCFQNSRIIGKVAHSVFKAPDHKTFQKWYEFLPLNNLHLGNHVG